jgi:hypothetical protein
VGNLSKQGGETLTYELAAISKTCCRFQQLREKFIEQQAKNPPKSCTHVQRRGGADYGLLDWAVEPRGSRGLRKTFGPVSRLHGLLEYLQENHRSHEVVSKNPTTQNVDQTVKASKNSWIARHVVLAASSYRQRRSNDRMNWDNSHRPSVKFQETLL